MQTDAGAGVVALSVGEACYPDDGTDAEQLLAEADRRMYKSKRLNKTEHANGIHILSPVLGGAGQPDRVN